MSRRISFTKMSGAGNDFIVLDASDWAGLSGDRTTWVRAVCRRGLSVGADGVLTIGSEGAGQVRVVFFNPDGGEAFCGNGSRCAARYAAARGLARPGMTLLTAAGPIPAVVDGAVVHLTLPAPADLGEVVLHGAGETFRGRWIDAGVPHLVVRVAGLADYPLSRVGPVLRRHPKLGPDGANVDLIEVDTSDLVQVRTWERGVENETLACGTGAVAAAMAARLAGASEQVRVVPRSGQVLTVTLPGEPSHPTAAHLSGDARFIFEGSLDPEATKGLP